MVCIEVVMTAINLDHFDKFKEDLIKIVMSDNFPYSNKKSLIDRLLDSKGRLPAILKEYYDLEVTFIDRYSPGLVEMSPADAILFALRWA